MDGTTISRADKDSAMGPSYVSVSTSLRACGASEVEPEPHQTETRG